MVEMEATNAELEDNNTRLEAAAMKADQQGAELASLQAALKGREQQHLALKVCILDRRPLVHHDGSKVAHNARKHWLSTLARILRMPYCYHTIT